MHDRASAITVKHKTHRFCVKNRPWRIRKTSSLIMLLVFNLKILKAGKPVFLLIDLYFI